MATQFMALQKDIRWEAEKSPLLVDVAGLRSAAMQLDGYERRFLLFVPQQYQIGMQIPLWILAPGDNDHAEKFLVASGLVQVAEQRNFAIAVLEGYNLHLNVQLNALAVDELPDDVRYTRAVLRAVAEKIRINMRQVYCAGFSRGARFCSRLASEFSSFVMSVAAVGGIRFPDPSNATRPLPIIAFHGTKDPINPFWGKGNTSYWDTSVPTAIQSWAHFNGCKSRVIVRIARDVCMFKHSDCKDDAEVLLIAIEGGGHTWPGSEHKFPGWFGHKTLSIDARELMWDFFRNHPVSPACHTSMEGETCHRAVSQAVANGTSRDSCLTHIQASLHRNIQADCPLPCEDGCRPVLPDLQEQSEAQVIFMFAGCVFILVMAVVIFWLIASIIRHLFKQSDCRKTSLMSLRGASESNQTNDSNGKTGAEFARATSEWDSLVIDAKNIKL